MILKFISQILVPWNAGMKVSDLFKEDIGRVFKKNMENAYYEKNA